MNGIINQSANFVTFSNLVIGVLAILVAVNGRYELSAVLILFSCLTDRLDGYLARKLGIESELGKYLDSNADLISFGVAPAILLYYSVLANSGWFGVCVVVIYVIAGAYRLARYNVLKFDGYYVGVPITMAGFVLPICILLKGIFPVGAFMALALILSFLMVSTIKIKKV